MKRTAKTQQAAIRQVQEGSRSPGVARHRVAPPESAGQAGKHRPASPRAALSQRERDAVGTPEAGSDSATPSQHTPLPDAFSLAFRRVPGGWSVSLGGKVLAVKPGTFGPLSAFVAALRVLAFGGAR